MEGENEILNPFVKANFDLANSWKWKFGETPEFSHTLEHKFDFGLIELCLNVEKCIITKAHVFSDSLNTDFIDFLNKALNEYGENFEYTKIGFENLIKYLNSRLETEIVDKEILNLFSDYLGKIKNQFINSLN